MTDADLLARAEAFDQDGRQIAWTPESVGTRMIEAASVFSRTPMRIGPSGASGFWPQVLTVALDLVDDNMIRRVMFYPNFDGDWSEYIDKARMREMSREIQKKWLRDGVKPEEMSRAEEALRWPALYLADRPLLADALTLWALCIGTGASLRATLRERAKIADSLRNGVWPHEQDMRLIAAARLQRENCSVKEIPIGTRQDFMPGKNFNLGLTWERRKKACAVICEALFAAGIALREADRDISIEANE